MRPFCAWRFEQGAHAAILGEAETQPAQRQHEAHSADALAPGQPAREQEAGQQAEGGREVQRAETEAVGVAQFERYAQYRVRGHAYRAHERKERGVGADQDVLPVVERLALCRHAPRAPARHRTGFEYGDLRAAPGKRDSGRHAGVAGADHGHAPWSVRSRYAATHVFQASQSLRRGVSEVRCRSTWKPSRSISVSSAR